MTHDFHGRHYTDPAGRVRLDVVEAAVRFFATHDRYTPRDVQVERAMSYARAEHDRMATNPLQDAIDHVDMVIARWCPTGHDSHGREKAITAFDERRPALLYQYGHGPAESAADAVHAGRDLAEWIIWRADDQRRGLRAYAESIFRGLIPANFAAAETLKEAQWAIADKVNPERRAAA